MRLRRAGRAGGADARPSSLRDRLPGLRLVVNAGGGSFKSQFKKADKSGALFALILGDDELARQVVGSSRCAATANSRILPGMLSAEHLDCLRASLNAATSECRGVPG